MGWQHLLLVPQSAPHAPRVSLCRVTKSVNRVPVAPSAHSAPLSAQSGAVLRECSSNCLHSMLTRKVQPRIKANSSEACQDCPAGKYSATSGLESEDLCIPCAPGKAHVANITGANASTFCEECPVGKFQDEPGRIRCKTPRDASFYADATGTTEVRIPEGAVLNCTHNAGRGVACKPKTCSAGTAATRSAAGCEKCPAGQSSPRGSTTCNPCEVGKFAAAGQPSCLMPQRP